MIPDKVVMKGHRRSYDDPIIVSAGERVRITKRDLYDGEHLWLWGINEQGKEGWIPASILVIEGETGRLTQDYSAMELTVEIGDRLEILAENGGWYWCENRSSQRGWVPISCFE